MKAGRAERRSGTADNEDGAIGDATCSEWRLNQDRPALSRIDKGGVTWHALARSQGA